MVIRIHNFTATRMIKKPKYLEGEYENSMNNKFNWTEDFKRELENMRRFGDQFTICRGQSTYDNGGRVGYPRHLVEYKPEDICSATRK